MGRRKKKCLLHVAENINHWVLTLCCEALVSPSCRNDHVLLWGCTHHGRVILLQDLSCCTHLLLARVTPSHGLLIPWFNLGASYLWLPPLVFLRMALVFVCSVQKELFSQFPSTSLQEALEKGYLVCAHCRDGHCLMGSPPVQCNHLCIPWSKSQTAHYTKLPNFKALSDITATVFSTPRSELRVHAEARRVITFLQSFRPWHHGIGRLSGSHAAGGSKCQVLPGGEGKGGREPAKLCRPKRKKLLQLKTGTRWYILLLSQLHNSDRRQSNSQDVVSLWLCIFIVYLLPPGACEARSRSSASLRRQLWHHCRKGERHEAAGDTETSNHDPTRIQPQIFYAIW